MHATVRWDSSKVWYCVNVDVMRIKSDVTYFTCLILLQKSWSMKYFNHTVYHTLVFLLWFPSIFFFFFVILFVDYSCAVPVIYRSICLLAPLTTSAQRSWWYYWLSVVRRPSSVNFCFKSLLLLQFLFDNSEFFTGETRHIVPPCNKAGISNFCLEFQKLQKFQISWKRYSSYSSYSKILNFLLEKLGI